MYRLLLLFSAVLGCAQTKYYDRSDSGQVLNSVDFPLGGGTYAARVTTSA